MNNDSESSKKDHKKHYRPLKGRAIPFEALAAKDKSGEKTNPYLYKKYQEQWRNERKEFQSAIKSMRDNPETIRPAHSGKFRNAEREAANRNAKKGTVNNGEDLRKISSKNFSNTSSHAIQNTKNSKIWGDKPVNSDQRSKEAKLHNYSKSLTDDGRKTQSPLGKNTSKRTNPSSQMAQNISRSALNQRTPILTNSQGGNSAGKNTSIGSGSVSKTTSPSISNTNSSSKGKSR